MSSFPEVDVEETKRTQSQIHQPVLSKVSSNDHEPKRRRTSAHWEHFVESDDPLKQRCIHCKSLVKYIPLNGTSGLSNHLSRCKSFPSNVDKKQKFIELERRTIVHEDGTIEIVNDAKVWKFDQVAARNALAVMIVLDELPFSFVEKEGFRLFCKIVAPMFVIPSRNTITRDCFGMFIEEKKKLKDCFSKMTSRVSLTTDCWTSGQNMGYMCLTAHFIDDKWKLHKRIINFCSIAGHSGAFIGRAVESCLLEWGLKNILTVTVDNASSNDVGIQYLRRRIDHWESSVLDDKYLHMRCAAHILNLVVRDGLKDLDGSILKVRNFVRYVRSSPTRLQSFRACVEEEGIECKGLVCLDVETRWNSTYIMLKTAVKFKKAFNSLRIKNATCHNELKKYGGHPTEDDWKRVDIFLPFLKIFYDATMKFSASHFVTGNICVPEIYEVGDFISTYCQDQDEAVRKMGRQMKEKHDKYWGNIHKLNNFLFVALIVDPRYKMTYVDWMVRNAYDEVNAILLMGKIKDTLKDLFAFYASSMPETKTKKRGSTSSFLNVDTGLIDQPGCEATLTRLSMKFLTHDMSTMDGNANRSELDKYLDEQREPIVGDFDILQWWKDNNKRYPIVAKMARDVLAMPVSTVASESAFSTGGRVLDSFRTSLTPRMVEALVCTQDWMRTSTKSIRVDNILHELEDMEEGMKELIENQPTIRIEESSILDDESFFSSNATSL